MTNLTIMGGLFSNAKTGIRVNGGHVRAEGVRFHDVEQPVDVRGGRLDISSSSVSESQKFTESREGATAFSPRKAAAGRAPTLCRDCGNLFGSTRYTVMNARFYAGSQVQEICPNCRSYNAFLETGLLEFAEETVRLLLGPDTTLEALERLLERASEELRGGIELSDPRDFLTEVTNKTPREPWDRNQKLTLWTIIFAVANMWQTNYYNDGWTRDAIQVLGEALDLGYQAIEELYTHPDKELPLEQDKGGKEHDSSSPSDPISI